MRAHACTRLLSSGLRAAARGSSFPHPSRQTRQGPHGVASAEDMPSLAMVASEPSGGSAGAGKDDELIAKSEFLARVPLLKRLPRSKLFLVAGACVIQDFCKGIDVVKQGEKGHEVFVIRSGEAVVKVVDDTGEMRTVASLKVGDYFGEGALLTEEVRSATITSETELSTFKITRGQFQELRLHEHLQFPNRRAVGGGKQRAKMAKKPTPKTPEDVQFISSAIAGNEALQIVIALDDARVKSMVDLMWKEEIQEGARIIAQGDLDVDFFYVVQEGCFDVLIAGEGAEQVASGAASDGDLVKTVRAGGCFGELALLYSVPRNATVKAKTNSIVWVLDRQNFQALSMQASHAKHQKYEKYLDGVAILQSLLPEEKKQLAKALVEMHFEHGETVLRQGEPGGTFYILCEGVVSIMTDGEGVTSLSASRTEGTAQYFGEGALLDSETRSATVVVSSETAKLLSLDRDSFDVLLGPLRDIIDVNRRDRARKVGPAMPVTTAASEMGCGTMRLEDLSRVGLLGCGGFGTVELYEHQATKQAFALKGISKGYIMEMGMHASVMNEKKISMMTKSDFIIKLYETYNSKQMLYFLLELALGGELYATYHRRGLYGSSKHCMYYTAGTVLALDHLHQKRIIYRDLKPENLLLTHMGHIKLTDMGLAKYVVGKTFTTCGTPDYFAPEVITSAGHTNGVDWWALGILVFELMSGSPPFEASHPLQTCANVKRGIGSVAFPPPCRGRVGDLITKLLNSDPSERLPMRPGGVGSLKAHEWFEGFDWDAMARLELPVPYAPVVKSHKDLTNFTATEADMPRIVQYRDPGTGWDRDFATVPDPASAAPSRASLSDQFPCVSCTAITAAWAWLARGCGA